MDVKTPQPPTFQPNVDLDAIDAQVSKLDLGPESIIVIKSNYIDVDVVRAVKEKFNRQVLGIGLDDDVLKLDVASNDVLVFKGLGVDSLNPDDRKAVADEVKRRTGCREVVFALPEVDIEVVTQGHCPRCSCE